MQESVNTILFFYYLKKKGLLDVNICGKSIQKKGDLGSLDKDFWLTLLPAMQNRASHSLCLQPMRQHRPAPTSPCSLASSCWCHSWVWPCIARTAGAHRECARSWRPLWLSTCCTWNSSCGAAGYGWPCSDWDRPQGETWSLLYFFPGPSFFLSWKEPRPTNTSDIWQGSVHCLQCWTTLMVKKRKNV